MGKMDYSPSPTEDKDNADYEADFDDLGKEGKDDMNVAQNRGQWSGKWDFLMAALSYAVGLGNLWRFPYLVYRNGGGAFLIPYIIMNFAAGIPLFLLEMAVGQFSSSGAVNVWRLCPLFRGMGVAMVTISALIAPYYNMMIAWAMVFLVQSFTATLPWSSCDNSWNSFNCSLLHTDELQKQRENCINGYPNATFKKGFCHFTDPGSGNSTEISLMNVSLVGPAHEYFHNQVLEMTEGLEEIGGLKWQLALALAGCWIIVFFVIMKGPQSTGKVAYFTALFPYLVLFILLGRGLSLPGSEKGIEYYLKPDWSKLLEPQVWGDAAVQVTFSLACGWGGILTLASYKRFHANIVRETYFICGVTTATAFLAGFVIFAVLGFMAEAIGVEVKDVAEQGAGLAFVVYPEAIANMPVAPLWSVLFFAMILTLGIGTQIAIVTTVVSAIVDSSPNFVTKRLLITVCFCIGSFICGIPLCTGGGMYILQLLDNYVAAWSIIIICILEMAILGFFYGFDRLLDDIECMIGYRPNIVWKILWSFVAPVTFSAILITILIQRSGEEGSTYGSYKFPAWADSCGLFGSFIPIFLIPLIAIAKVVPGRGSVLSKLRELTKPSASWGPANCNDRRSRLRMSPTVASTLPMLAKTDSSLIGPVDL